MNNEQVNASYYLQTPTKEHHGNGGLFTKQEFTISHYTKGNVHFHESFEVLITNNAQGRILIEGMHYELESYCAYLIPPNLLHQIIYSQSNVRIRLLHIALPQVQQYLNIPDILEQTQQRILTKAKAFASDTPKAHWITKLVNELHSTLTLTGSIALLAQLLPDLLEPIPSNDTSSHNKPSRLVQSIMRYTEEYISEPLSLSFVAQKFAYNTSYISRQFKKYTKITYGEYLTQCRIERSLSLLQQPYGISQISTMVGIDNPSYFIKLFKGQMHCTPKQYQKKISE